jgi:hypothetical protein
MGLGAFVCGFGNGSREYRETGPFVFSAFLIGGSAPAIGGSRTPAIGGSRTPATGGSRTPATGGSRTPAIGGSRTPVIGETALLAEAALLRLAEAAALLRWAEAALLRLGGGRKPHFCDWRKPHFCGCPVFLGLRGGKPQGRQGFFAEYFDTGPEMCSSMRGELRPAKPAAEPPGAAPGPPFFPGQKQLGTAGSRCAPIYFFTGVYFFLLKTDPGLGSKLSSGRGLFSGLKAAPSRSSRWTAAFFSRGV